MKDWLRQENGMLRPAPPCKAKELYCSRCHCLTQTACRFWGGQTICEACFPAFLEEQADGCAQDFIDRHAFEYYVTWWFQGLEPNEQLAAIRAAYSRQEAESKGDSRLLFAADRRDFCLLHPYFPEFLCNRLGKIEEG